MVDKIERVRMTVIVFSPLLLLALVALSAISLSRTGNDRTTVKWALSLSLFLGVVGITEIKPGGWNLQYIMAPFFMSQWAFIAYAFIWPLVAAERQIKQRPVVLTSRIFIILGMAGLTLAIAAHTYIPQTLRQDKEFWKKVLETNDAGLPLSAYQTHLSREGREAVAKYISEDTHSKKGPHLSVEMLHLLDSLDFSVIEHPRTDRALIEKALGKAKAAEAGHHPGSSAGYGFSVILAQNPHMPADVLDILSDHPSAQVQKAIALNPGAPPALLERMIDKNEALINNKKQESEYERKYAYDIYQAREVIQFSKRNIASNPRTPAKRVRELARDEDVEVRRQAARNPNAPLDLLESLGRDRDWQTKKYALITLGRSPRTPKNRLAELSRDPDRLLREAVAQNSAASNELLLKLITDDEYGVWSVAFVKLANQPKPPIEVLKKRMSNMNDRAKIEFMRELDIPEWLQTELVKRSALGQR